MFFLPFVIFGVFFVVFLVIGLNAFKSHKHTTDTMTNMINTVSAYAEKQTTDISQQADNQAKQETKICEYCGSIISANETKCNSCGAKIKK